MTVTHMSHRDGSVTPPVCHAVSHVPRRSAPPTRPDPTHSIRAEVFIHDLRWLAGEKRMAADAAKIRGVR